MGSLVSTMGSKGAAATHPQGKPRYWYRDNFFLTNDKAYLEPQAINAVFESDLMWWNDPLPEHQMRKMISNCMTMSIYHVPESEKQMQSASPHSFLYRCLHMRSSLRLNYSWGIFFNGAPIECLS